MPSGPLVKLTQSRATSADNSATLKVTMTKAWRLVRSAGRPMIQASAPLTAAATSNPSQKLPPKRTTVSAAP